MSSLRDQINLRNAFCEEVKSSNERASSCKGPKTDKVKNSDGEPEPASSSSITSSNNSSSSISEESNQDQLELMKHQLMQSRFKDWITKLNLWVVRCENLKKFTLKEELGEGGQARVFKIEKKPKGSQIEKVNGSRPSQKILIDEGG